MVSSTFWQLDGAAEKRFPSLRASKFGAGKGFAGEPFWR
jgi:hypothetical protein